MSRIPMRVPSALTIGRRPLRRGHRHGTVAGLFTLCFDPCHLEIGFGDVGVIDVGEVRQGDDSSDKGTFGGAGRPFEP